MLNTKLFHLPIIAGLIPSTQAQSLPTGREIAERYTSTSAPSNSGGIGNGYLYSITDEEQNTISYLDYSYRNLKKE